MKKDRFEYLCMEAEAGRDAFVRHPDSNEEGLVTSCLMKAGQIVVNTPSQQTRCWDFIECEDLIHPKYGPLI
jgi:hypothetical protein